MESEKIYQGTPSYNKRRQKWIHNVQNQVKDTPQGARILKKYKSKNIIRKKAYLKIMKTETKIQTSGYTDGLTGGRN